MERNNQSSPPSLEDDDQLNNQSQHQLIDQSQDHNQISAGGDNPVSPTSLQSSEAVQSQDRLVLASIPLIELPDSEEDDDNQDEDEEDNARERTQSSSIDVSQSKSRPLTLNEKHLHLNLLQLHDYLRNKLLGATIDGGITFTHEALVEFETQIHSQKKPEWCSFKSLEDFQGMMQRYKFESPIVGDGPERCPYNYRHHLFTKDDNVYENLQQIIHQRTKKGQTNPSEKARYIRTTPSLKKPKYTKTTPSSEKAKSKPKEMEKEAVHQISKKLKLSGDDPTSFEEYLVRWLPSVIRMLLEKGFHSDWVPKLNIKKAIVECCNPVTGCRMHFYNLMAAIVGDTIGRMFEFCQINCTKITQTIDFGIQVSAAIGDMLETYPNVNGIDSLTIGNLQKYSNEANRKLRTDGKFQEKAQQEAVLFQGGKGSAKHNKAWELIYNITRQHFQQMYNRLSLCPAEKGSRLYIPQISNVLKSLKEKKLLENLYSLDRDIAGVGMMLDDNPALLCAKDGNFTSTATTLTILRDRIENDKAEWIIYVASSKDEAHYQKCFKAAKSAGWLLSNDNSTQRVSFVSLELDATGLNSTPNVPAFLDTIKSRFEAVLTKRGGFSADKVATLADALACGGIRYSVLKHNREESGAYRFNIAEMLDLDSNSAYNLLDVYADLCAAIRVSGRLTEDIITDFEVKLEQTEAKELALHIQKFPRAVQRACELLSPHIVCDFVYNLAQQFSEFKKAHDLDGPALLLCLAAKAVMEKCLELLGIPVVDCEFSD